MRLGLGLSICQPRGGLAGVAMSGSGTAVTAGIVAQISVPLVANISAGQLLVLVIAHKHATEAIATPPTGWTALPNSVATGGSGAQGTSGGIVYASIFTREATGSESGDVVVDLPATTSASAGQMFSFQRPVASYSLTFTSGVDSTPDNSWIVAGGGDPGVTTNDLLFCLTAVNSQNSTFTGESLAQTGVTYNPQTKHTDANISRLRMIVTTHRATGNGAGVPTFTASVTGSETSQPAGVTLMMRMRSSVLFDPGSLALQGFWRGSFGGSPWVGVSSQGGSGSRNLTEATNPPTAGTAVNGFTPALFDGTNDELTGAACSNFITTTNFSFGALVNFAALSIDNTSNYFLNHTIFGTTGTAEWAVYARANGGAGLVGCATGASNRVEIALGGAGTGAWKYVQGKSNGTTLSIRVNGGTAVTATASTIGSLAAALNVGDLASSFLNGSLLDLYLTTQHFSLATEDSLLSYARGRYALALT